MKPGKKGIPIEARRALATATALFVAGTPVLTGCSLDNSDDDQAQNVYCVNSQGEIIDPEYCDDDNGYYYGGQPTFLWITSSHHDYGYHVPRNARSHTTFFQSNSPTARQRAGLPTTGRAPTTVRRPGGFGSSRGGSGSHGTTGRGSSGSSGSHGFGGHSGSSGG